MASGEAQCLPPGAGAVRSISQGLVNRPEVILWGKIRMWIRQRFPGLLQGFLLAGWSMPHASARRTMRRIEWRRLAARI